MLVEPEPRQVSRLKELLAPLAADFVWGKDGGEGVRYAFSHYPDLILVNTKLPAVSGVQMVRLLNMMGLRIPTIFVAEQAEFLKYKTNLPQVEYSCWISRMAEELLPKATEILDDAERSFRDVQYVMDAGEFLGLLSRHDRKKILVAADVQVVRNLCGQLEANGYYEVYSAIDGREALFKAVALQPDLLLLAHQLPTLDGDSLARLLYILGHPLPIVMLTLHQNPTLQEEMAHLEGVKDFWISGQCMADRRMFQDSVQKLVDLTERDKEKLDKAYREIDSMNLGGGSTSPDLMDDPTLFQEFEDIDLD